MSVDDFATSPGHGPLTRYVKLCVAHPPGLPGTFSPPPASMENASLWSRHASRHVRHARAVMHAGISILWGRGKRSRHSRRMRNPQFYVSGKRPIMSSLNIPINGNATSKCLNTNLWDGNIDLSDDHAYFWKIFMSQLYLFWVFFKPPTSDGYM